MSKTKISKATPTPKTGTPSKTFALSPEVLAKLSEQVSFADDAALNQFMADAINSYLQLGRLHQAGGAFLLKAEGRDDLVTLHFPFSETLTPAVDAQDSPLSIEE
jgi:hypothetical protein